MATVTIDSFDDLVLWPFAVDWKSSVKVTLSHKTEIITSRSGKEQRRALRATPRKTVEFGMVALNGTLRALRGHLARSQHKSSVLADPTRAVALALPVDVGDDEAIVQSVPDWLIAGSVVVFTEGKRREMRKVVSVVGTAVTFTAGGEAWSATALLRPGLIGMIAPEQRTSMPTNGAATGTVRFEVTPASEPPRSLSAAPTTFDGREVFTRRPNWRSGIELSYSHPSQVVDYGRGRTAVFRPIAFGAEIFAANFVGMSLDAVDDIEQFVRRAKGSRGEFFMSSGIEDMVLAAGSASGSNTLTASGTDLFNDYADDTVHRAVEVVMNDGRRFYRRLASPGLTTAGGNTVVHLTAALPYAVAPADVLRVSWLPLCRLAGDEVTLEYLTSSAAQTRLVIQTLEYNPAE